MHKHVQVQSAIACAGPEQKPIWLYSKCTYKAAALMLVKFTGREAEDSAVRPVMCKFLPRDPVTDKA